VFFFYNLNLERRIFSAFIRASFSPLKDIIFKASFKVNQFASDISQP